MSPQLHAASVNASTSYLPPENMVIHPLQADLRALRWQICPKEAMLVNEESFLEE